MGETVYCDGSCRPRESSAAPPKHRNPRRRKRTPASANLTTAFRHAGALAENPNRGKRGAAPATNRDHDLTVSESAGALGLRRDYAPLTVHTPIRRARIAPRTTSYTI